MERIMRLGSAHGQTGSRKLINHGRKGRDSRDVVRQRLLMATAILLLAFLAISPSTLAYG